MMSPVRRLRSQQKCGATKNKKTKTNIENHCLGLLPWTICPAGGRPERHPLKTEIIFSVFCSFSLSRKKKKKNDSSDSDIWSAPNTDNFKSDYRWRFERGAPSQLSPWKHVFPPSCIVLLLLILLCHLPGHSLNGSLHPFLIGRGCDGGWMQHPWPIFYIYLGLWNAGSREIFHSWSAWWLARWTPPLSGSGPQTWGDTTG